MQACEIPLQITRNMFARKSARSEMAKALSEAPIPSGPAARRRKLGEGGAARPAAPRGECRSAPPSALLLAAAAMLLRDHRLATARDYFYSRPWRVAKMNIGRKPNILFFRSNQFG